MSEALEAARGVVSTVSDRRVLVSVDGAFECPRCREGRGCGAGLMGAGRPERRIRVRVPPNLQLSTGDPVILTLSSRIVTRAALIAYGVPLAAMTLPLAVLAAAGLTTSDLMIGIVALVGLGCGILAAKRLLSGDDACDRYTPELARVPDTKP